MILPLQLSYPVETLDHRVLLPAGTNLTQETMDELVRKSRAETFPRRERPRTRHWRNGA